MVTEAQMADDGAGVLLRLRRRKFWFVAGAAACMGVVLAVVTVLPRSYKSTAKIMVAGNEVLVGGASPADMLRLGDVADVESQVLMLRSPRLMARMLKSPSVRQMLQEECEAARRQGTALGALRARLAPPEPCETLTRDEGRALARLEDGFTVSPVGRSRVIEVAFTSPLAAAAPAMVNALVDVFLADDRARKVDIRDDAIAWLKDEVARSGEALRRAEVAAERYRSEHGLVRGQLASISSERLSLSGQQLAAAQAALADAQARLQRLGSRPADLREVLENRTISDLKQQSAQLVTARAQAIARLGSGHPDVAELSRAQTDLQAQLDREYARIGTSLVRERDAAKLRVDQLSSGLDQLRQGVSQAAGAEAGMATLVRDAEVAREIFTHLSRKVNELEVERRLVPGDARLVHKALVPEKPWFPKPLPFLVVGAMLSLIAGAAAAILRDRSDRTVRTDSGLARLSGVPVIGRIPRAPALSRREGLDAQLGRPTVFQEAIRSVFARCVLMPSVAPQALLVTSSAPGEGKTLLAVSMARLAASTGRRVLILECDLRRPGFTELLHLPRQAGMTEFLRGEADLAGIVIAGGTEGPDVIPAGSAAIDSTELLSSGRMGSLMAELRRRYDLILIDSPPSQLLMDARLLARHADGTLYCVSWGRSRLTSVVDGMEGIEAAGGRLLGIAVGMVRPRQYPLYEPRAVALAAPGVAPA